VTILAIESSCDESSAAVLKDGALLSVATRTQTIHRAYGGVVPELAGRSHLELVDAMAHEALSSAEVSLKSVDLFAATLGPGLVGSLLVGAAYARGLALALGKRFRAVHHLEAHLWSAELEARELPLPFLILLVSGGHTQLVLVEGLRRYRVIGMTLDDALGEAYDKVGKLVGLTFPAGADVDRLASEGDPTKFQFTVPLRDDSCDFSFSGLKTAFLYKLRGLSDEQTRAERENLLAAFQEAALGSVMTKVRRAALAERPRALAAAGGVAANSRLRAKLSDLARELGIACVLPEPQFCGDNAAMIGYTAFKLEHAQVMDSFEDGARPRWPLEALCVASNAV